MDLDRNEEFGRLDITGILRNIDELPDQVETAWNELQNFILPSHYVQATSVVFVGLGANNVAFQVISEIADPSTFPIIVWDKPGLPNFVNNKTLVVACSYSGDTVETLESFDIAASKGAKLIGISSGGTLGSLCRKFKVPHYDIQYGSPQRAALGYMVAAVYMIGVKLGFFDRDTTTVHDAVALMRGLQQKIRAEVPTSKNLAKQIAIQCKGKIPIAVGMAALAPAARRFVLQNNETVHEASFAMSFRDLKTIGIYGLQLPFKLHEKCVFLLFESYFAHSFEKEEATNLLQHFKRRGIGVEQIGFDPAGSPLAESLQGLLLADYIAYYEAILNDIDPETARETL